jgi:HSP20 family molecular chaperone IbpA
MAQTHDRPREIEPRGKHAVTGEQTRPGPVFRPDVDILERADEFVVTADLPGVDEQHVHVRLDRGVLVIDAELASGPEAGWTPLHSEYRAGGYHREFTLSDEIDAERIRAVMRDGVLELRLPKSEAHRPRSIPVQAA